MRDPPLCTLAELKNGTYSLNDLADFHEAMDEEDEYQRRHRDVQRHKQS
jgi:hypothetical protein